MERRCVSTLPIQLARCKCGEHSEVLTNKPPPCNSNQKQNFAFPIQYKLANGQTSLSTHLLDYLVQDLNYGPRPITKLFYGEGLLALHPTPKLEDHPLSAVCDCLFNIFTATLYTGGCASICNLRMRHAVVTGTLLSWVNSVTCKAK